MWFLLDSNLDILWDKELREIVSQRNCRYEELLEVSFNIYMVFVNYVLDLFKQI